MSIMKDDVTKAVGNLQLRGVQDAGYESAVHSMYDIFRTNKTEVVLFVDAENAFSSINRQVFFPQYQTYMFTYSYFCVQLL